MESNGQSGANFWRGMFVGAIVGSLTVLLSTPRTGGEMRTVIRENAGKTKNKVSEWRHRHNEKKDEELQSVGAETGAES